MELAYPFHLDAGGRAAGARYDDHIRQLIEQVLFTSPGERVNLPQFGCGLMQLVFANQVADLASTTKLVVQGALQRWLGQLIQVASVAATTEDSTLTITISYSLITTGQRRTATFQSRIG